MIEPSDKWGVKCSMVIYMIHETLSKIPPQMFDRETKGAYALEIEARDGAPSARPHSNGQPNAVSKVRH